MSGYDYPNFVIAFNLLDTIIVFRLAYRFNSRFHYE